MKHNQFKNGDKIATIGLGTWKSEKGAVKDAVIEAIKCGYKHIDCAAIYGNEKEIGEALTFVFSNNIVKRDELFITSKLWNDQHKEEDVLPALKKTLSDLQLEYIDLYLMHWPVAMKKDAEQAEFLSLEDVPLLETWNAMIDAKNKGLVKHLGVSNFSIKKINHLNENSNHKVEMNQVEIHPFLSQNELKTFCDKEQILMTAYAPLGSTDRNSKKDSEPNPLTNEIISQLASKKDCSNAQIVIAWLQARGITAIPKSTNKGRIQENLNADKIELNNEEMKQMNDLDKHYRLIDGSFWTDNPHYTKENLWDE